jgi:hypothetical protein
VYGKNINAYSVSARNFEVGELGRHKWRWGYNTSIKNYLREKKMASVDWFDLAQDTVQRWAVVKAGLSRQAT